MSEITIKTSDIMKTMAINVKISRAIGPRVWLGAQCIRIASWIIGCNFLCEFKRATVPPAAEDAA